MEDITDADWKHVKRVWKNFKLNDLGDYLYVQNDTLLLSDVFGNSRNRCTESYEFDPAHFSLAPGLV